MTERRNCRVVIMFTLWANVGVYHYLERRSRFEERADGTRYNETRTLCRRRLSFIHWRPMPGPVWHQTIAEDDRHVHYLPEAAARKLGRLCERCAKADA